MSLHGCVSLHSRNSLGVPCIAEEVAVARSVEELELALKFDGNITILGGCTNVVLLDWIPGRVVFPRIEGVEVNRESGAVSVRAGAGVVWHELVLETLRRGVSGLENLALIPGLVGGAPFQNIGAYGRELAECVESVDVFDRIQQKTRRLAAHECGFAYRTSLFRDQELGRYVITHLNLVLRRRTPRIDYPGVEEELERISGDPLRAEDVAEAVICLRQRKLPEPSRYGNVGSFFKNPVVSPDIGRRLNQNGVIQKFPEGGSVKISAASLIEAAGWRGRQIGEVLVWPDQPLVLVNAGRATGRDFLAVASRISADVLNRFGVALDLEPLVVGCERQRSEPAISHTDARAR